MPPKRKGPARASAVAAAKKLRAIEDDGNDDDEFLPAEEQKPNEVQFVHKPYKSNATFLSLIDDCVFSIFDRLSLNDLCSIAQTCKQLYRTSSEYFMQRHKSKVSDQFDRRILMKCKDIEEFERKLKTMRLTG